MKAEGLKPGQEQYETYYSSMAKRRMVQYDRRHSTGKLFSCIAKDTTTAYGRFLDWCKKNNLQPE